MHSLARPTAVLLLLALGAGGRASARAGGPGGAGPGAVPLEACRAQLGATEGALAALRCPSQFRATSSYRHIPIS